MIIVIVTIIISIIIVIIIVTIFLQKLQNISSRQLAYEPLYNEVMNREKDFGF
jgi:hypothetical protein